MADAKIKKLEREIKTLEEECDRIADRIELTEVRLQRAKGRSDEAEISSAERRLEELDKEFDEKDAALSQKKEQLEAIVSGKVVLEEDDAAAKAKRAQQLAEQQKAELENTERLRREDEERRKQAQAAAAEKISRIREEATQRDTEETERLRRQEEERRRAAQAETVTRLAALKESVAKEEQQQAAAAAAALKADVRTGKAWAGRPGEPGWDSSSNLLAGRGGGGHEHGDDEPPTTPRDGDKKKKGFLGGLFHHGGKKDGKKKKEKKSAGHKHRDREGPHSPRDPKPSPSKEDLEPTVEVPDIAEATSLSPQQQRKLSSIKDSNQRKLMSTNFKTSSATLSRFGGGQADLGLNRELNKRFEQFLDAIGVVKHSERDAWHNDYSNEAKARLLHALAHVDFSKPLGNEHTPEYFVGLLRSNTGELDELRKLRMQLEAQTLEKAGTSSSWMEQFVKINGIQWLCDALDTCQFQAAKSAALPELRTLAQSRNEEDVRQANRLRTHTAALQRLEILLGCVVRLVDLERLTAKEFVNLPATVASLTNSIALVPHRKKTGLFDLLVAICVMSAPTWELVVAAFQEFARRHAQVLDDIVREFADGSDAEFRCSFLSLVNTLIVRAETASHRVAIRDIFAQRSLGRVLQDLKERQLANEQLLELIQVFEEEVASDLAELSVGSSSAEPLDELAALQAALRTKDKGLAASVSAVVHQLRLVAESEHSDSLVAMLQPTLAAFSEIAGQHAVPADQLKLETILKPLMPRVRNVRSQSSVVLANPELEAKIQAAEAKLKEEQLKAANLAAELDGLKQQNTDLQAQVKNLAANGPVAASSGAAASSSPSSSSSSSSSSAAAGATTTDTLVKAAEEAAPPPAPKPATETPAAEAPPAGGPPPPPPPPPPGFPPGFSPPPPPPPPPGFPPGFAPPPPPPGGPPGGPPPPPPPPGGPPGAPPPPPGFGPPGAPPPPGFGGFGGPTWHDPKRPELVPWRWTPLRGPQAEGTVLAGMDPTKRFDGLDKELIEAVFKAPPKGRGNKAGDDSGAAAPETPRNQANVPKVLSTARCQNIELSMRGIAAPAETIKHSICNANLDILDLGRLSNLQSLCGTAEKYEEDYKRLVADFKDDPGDLAPPEYYLRTLFLVPNLPKKLTALTQAQELDTRVEGLTQTAALIREMITDLRAPKVKEFFEYCFTLGAYINNPKGAPPAGIQFQSFLKLQDTKSRVPHPDFGGKPVSLLTLMVIMLEKSNPELINWYQEIRQVSKGGLLLETFSIELAALASAHAQLTRMGADAEGPPEEAPLRKFFAEQGARAGTALKELEVVLTEVTAIAKFFGDNTAEQVEFFKGWGALALAFELAVKGVTAQRKKEEAARLREEKAKAKAEADELAKQNPAANSGARPQRRPPGAAASSSAASSTDKFGGRVQNRAVRNPGGARAARTAAVDSEFDAIMASISAAADETVTEASDTSVFSSRASRRRQLTATDEATPTTSTKTTLRSRDAFDSLRRNRQSNTDGASSGVGLDAIQSEETRRALLSQTEQLQQRPVSTLLFGV